jgi:hypothetical protein
VAIYDLAAVGYFTLPENGLIADVNLTGAKQLGVERKKLQHCRFDHYVVPAYRDYWHRIFISVMNATSASVPLMLQRDDGSIFKVHMDCRHDESGQAKPVLCITVIDFTDSCFRAKDINNRIVYPAYFRMPANAKNHATLSRLILIRRGSAGQNQRFATWSRPNHTTA